MANIRRNASAVWAGTIREGKGTLTTKSGTLKETPYSFSDRFENGTGTNPEELIAAAHAGCFTMALSGRLTSAGHTPERLETRADLTMEQADGGWRIASVALELKAKVPGIEQDEFKRLADDAKANCPVSQVLKAEISLKAELE